MSFLGETASTAAAAGKTKFFSILSKNDRYRPIETKPNPPDQLDIPRQSEKDAPEAAKKKRFQLSENMQRRLNRLKSIDLRKRGNKKEIDSSTEVLEPPAPPKNDFSALLPKNKTPRAERFVVLDSSLERVEKWHADTNAADQASTAARSKILQELEEAEKLQKSPNRALSEEEAAQSAQASRDKIKEGLSEGQLYDRGWSRTEADRILPEDSAIRRQRGGFAFRDDIKESGEGYSKRTYDKVHWHERLLPEARKAVDRTTTSRDDLMALHAQQGRLMNSNKVRDMSLEEFEADLAAFEAKTSPEAKQQLLTTYSGGPYGSVWTPRDALMDKRRDAFLESAEAAFKKKHEGQEYSSDRGVREQYRAAQRQHMEDTHKAAYEKYPTTSPLEEDKDGNLQVVSHTFKDIGHQTGPNDTKSAFDFFNGISPQNFKQRALEAEGLSERDFSSWKRRGELSDQADIQHQQALQKVWNAPKNIDPEKLKIAAQAQQDLEKFPEWQQAVASVEKGESNNTNHWFIKNWPSVDHRAVKLWQTTYEHSPNGIYERVVKARSNPSKYTSEQEYT